MPVGVFRRVCLLGRFAVKVPRLSNFRAGLCCNRWEREMWLKWRPKFGWGNLCPVLITAPFGLILIMRRAHQPVTFEDVEAADKDCYPDIHVEYKPENWGRLGDRIVCVDYGIPFEQDVTERRRYLSKFPEGHQACPEE